MGIYYSADHTAEDHIHTDIICNTEEPQQKYRLGTFSNRLLEGGRGRGGRGLNMFYWIQTLALSFCSGSNHLVCMKVSHQWVNIGNKHITNKAYGKSKMRTRFKGSYNKQNLTLMVILWKIYETRGRFVLLISYEMTTRVRSSISGCIGTPLWFQPFYEMICDCLFASQKHGVLAKRSYILNTEWNDLRKIICLRQSYISVGRSSVYKVTENLLELARQYRSCST